MINYYTLIKRLGNKSSKLSSDAGKIALANPDAAKKLWAEQDLLVIRINKLIDRQNRQEKTIDLSKIDWTWNTASSSLFPVEKTITEMTIAEVIFNNVVASGTDAYIMATNNREIDRSIEIAKMYRDALKENSAREPAWSLVI